MIRSLQNIQSAFSLVRIYMVLVTVITVAVSGYAVWKSFQFAEKQREKIYVLDGGASLLMALQQDVNQNRPAEARAHVKLFHEYFFTISPDKSAIEQRLIQALALAGNEAYEQYKNLKEDGFYDRVIAAGINCEIQTDSVIVDTNVYPFMAYYYGKTAIVRSSNITYRNLETQCELISCARSDNNPHGFVIEKWKILDNSDLSVVNK
ncbi:MAG: conjugative transposon protein TraK [Paludibacteraceae bacterium]|nr:conjugative transposon protein TraK [Paludibacteraceae bacterium]